MKINLLRVKVSRLSKADRIRRYNKVLLFVFSGAFCLFFGAYLVQVAFYSVQSGSLLSRVRVVEAEYAQRSAEAVEYRRIRELLTQAGTVIKNRYPYRAMIDSLYKILPEGVEVIGASFGERGLMTFSVKASGVRKYQDFLAVFGKESVKEEFMFKEVVEKKLTRSLDGSYRVELQLATKI